MQVLRRMILTFVGITVTFAAGIFLGWAQNSVTAVVRPTPPGNSFVTLRHTKPQIVVHFADGFRFCS